MNILHEVGISTSVHLSYFETFKHVIFLCKVKSISILEFKRAKQRLSLWISNIRKRRNLLAILANLQKALDTNTNKRIQIESKLQNIRLKISALKQFVYEQMHNHYMEQKHIATLRGQNLIFDMKTAEKWLTHSEYLNVENAKYCMIVEDVLAKQLDAVNTLSNNLQETLLGVCNLLSYTEFSAHLFEIGEITNTLENVNMSDLSVCISQSITTIMENLQKKNDVCDDTTNDAENALSELRRKPLESEKFKERFFIDIFDFATKLPQIEMKSGGTTSHIQL